MRKPGVKITIVRMVAIVCAVVITASSFVGRRAYSSGFFGSCDGHYLGDVDANGEVEPSDARRIRRMFEGLEPLPTAVSNPSDPASRIFDVNGDGTVNADDAALVLQIAVGPKPSQMIMVIEASEGAEGVSWTVVTEERTTAKQTERQTQNTDTATEKRADTTAEIQTEATTKKKTETTTEKLTEEQTGNQTAAEYVPEVNLKIGTYNVGLYSYGASPGIGKKGYRLETDVAATDENKAKKDALYAKKTGQVKRFFGNQGFDLLALQEDMIVFTRKLSDGAYVNNEAIKSTELFFDPFFPYVFSHSHGCGLTLCSRYEMSEKKNGLFSTKYDGKQCYYLKCVIYVNGKRVVLANTHLQPVKGIEGSAEYAGSIAAQEGQMAELTEAFADEKNVIIFGDWNRLDGDFTVMTNAGYTMLNGFGKPMEPTCRQSWKRPTVNTAAEMDPALYREYVYGGHEAGYEWGARYIYENGVWVKNRNPDGNETDRYLDNIAVKGDIAGAGRVVDILGDSLSDHLPFVADIVIR